MKSATLKILIGTLLLTLVAAWPAPRPVHRETVPRPSGSLRWDVLPWPLAAGIDARDRWYAQASSRPTRVKLERPARHGTGYSSTAACILARENGGDYGRSSNPTHFGAYQYDRQTWAAHGGNPEDWGTASPEEQDRVFAEGTAKYGYGAWTPYDGC